MKKPEPVLKVTVSKDLKVEKAKVKEKIQEEKTAPTLDISQIVGKKS